MTTVRFTVDDERLESIKRILREIPFVHDIEVEIDNHKLQEPSTQYERIKTILDEAKGKGLFDEIKEPSEWQREIRKEWDRDF